MPNTNICRPLLTSCPDVTTLWEEAYGKKETAEATGTGDAAKPAEPSAEQKRRDDASKAIRNMNIGPQHVDSITTKCQQYCKQIQEAEAERCRLLREKVMYALEAAGCPSNVTAKAGTTGCGPCQFAGTSPKVATQYATNNFTTPLGLAPQSGVPSSINAVYTPYTSGSGMDWSVR